MTSPDGRPPANGTRFRDRFDLLAARALESIPCAGPSLAEFFSKVVVPTLSGPRDRILDGLGRGLRLLTGRKS